MCVEHKLCPKRHQLQHTTESSYAGVWQCDTCKASGARTTARLHCAGSQLFFCRLLLLLSKPKCEISLVCKYDVCDSCKSKYYDPPQSPLSTIIQPSVAAVLKPAIKVSDAVAVSVPMTVNQQINNNPNNDELVFYSLLFANLDYTVELIIISQNNIECD